MSRIFQTKVRQMEVMFFFHFDIFGNFNLCRKKNWEIEVIFENRVATLTFGAFPDFSKKVSKIKMDAIKKIGKPK